jgi:hypothetical protein
MGKRRVAAVGLVGACALVGLAPTVASAATITQTYIGKQDCNFQPDKPGLNDTKRVQIVRWDIPNQWTRAYELDIENEGNNWPVARVQAEQVDAKTGHVIGHLLDTANSGQDPSAVLQGPDPAQPYIVDNYNSGNGYDWTWGQADHHYYLWIWILLENGQTCSLEYNYY